MALCAFAVALLQPWTLLAQAPAPARVKYAQVSPADLKEWLIYLSSDTLQGRQVFSEGYGLAASYMEERYPVTVGSVDAVISARELRPKLIEAINSGVPGA